MKYLLICFFTLTMQQLTAQSLLSGFSLKHHEKVIAFGGGIDVSKTYFIKSSTISFKRNIQVLGAYAAVGLKKEWNLIASYSVIDMTPQDIKFGFSKAWLHHQSFHFVFGLGLFGPTSNYQTEGGFAVGQQARGIWMEQIIQYRGNGYHLDLGIGLNATDAPTPTTLPVSLTYGKSFNKSYLKVFAAYQHSFGNKFYRGVGNESPTTFKELAVSYTKVGAQWIYTKTSWLPYLGVAQILHGQNVFKATSISAGIIKKF